MSGGDVVCLSWVAMADELAGETGRTDFTSSVLWAAATVAMPRGD